MKLALFGTNPYPFVRLAVFLERLSADYPNEFVVQRGETPPPSGCESFAYASRQEILRLISRADVVIAQGGYGSSLDVLQAGKPLILVPRLKQMRECRDDQTELVNYLCASNYAKRADTYSELSELISLQAQGRWTSTVAQAELGMEVSSAILQFVNSKKCSR